MGKSIENNQDKGLLLQQMQSEIPSDTSYTFSIVSLSIHNMDVDNIVCSGAVSDFDTLGDLDAQVEDLFAQESEAQGMTVVSHVFSIGFGESESMPEHLAKLIEQYGVEDFITLDEVDQIARYDFTLDACDFGL